VFQYGSIHTAVLVRLFDFGDRLFEPGEGLGKLRNF
jgi:hypothetical protein